jgi:hypothetical protein
VALSKHRLLGRANFLPERYTSAEVLNPSGSVSKRGRDIFRCKRVLESEKKANSECKQSEQTECFVLVGQTGRSVLRRELLVEMLLRDCICLVSSVDVTELSPNWSAPKSKHELETTRAILGWPTSCNMPRHQVISKPDGRPRG